MLYKSVKFHYWFLDLVCMRSKSLLWLHLYHWHFHHHLLFFFVRCLRCSSTCRACKTDIVIGFIIVYIQLRYFFFIFDRSWSCWFSTANNLTRISLLRNDLIPVSEHWIVMIPNSVATAVNIIQLLAEGWLWKLQVCHASLQDKLDW